MANYTVTANFWAIFHSMAYLFVHRGHTHQYISFWEILSDFSNKILLFFFMNMKCEWDFLMETKQQFNFHVTMTQIWQIENPHPIVSCKLYDRIYANRSRGGCRKKMVVARVNVLFSILDEYERRMNETLLAGFGAGFPGKFENFRPPQM